MKHKKYTDELVKEVANLRLSGMTAKEISEGFKKQGFNIGEQQVMYMILRGKRLLGIEIKGHKHTKNAGNNAHKGLDYQEHDVPTLESLRSIGTNTVPQYEEVHQEPSVPKHYIVGALVMFFIVFVLGTYVINNLVINNI